MPTTLGNRKFRPPPPPQPSPTAFGDNKEYARRWRRMKLRTSFEPLAIVLTVIILIMVVVAILAARLGFLSRMVF